MAIQDPRLALSVKQIEKRIDKLKVDFQGAAKSLVAKHLLIVRRDAKNRFVPGSTKGENKVGDVRDEKGELRPHRRTGVLSRSIQKSEVEVTKDFVQGAVFTDESSKEYAKAVEFGYRPRNQRAHPFMVPAREATQKDFIEAAQQLRNKFK